MSAYPPVPAILQSGEVTPGHVAAWATNGVLVDGGASASTGLNSVATGLVGAGATQATATPIQAAINVASSVPLNSGFILPALTVGGLALTVGTEMKFFNRSGGSGNVASVYPSLGFQIEAEGVNNPVGVAVNGQSTFTLVTSTLWLVS